MPWNEPHALAEDCEHYGFIFIYFFLFYAVNHGLLLYLLLLQMYVKTTIEFCTSGFSLVTCDFSLETLEIVQRCVEYSFRIFFFSISDGICLFD